MEDAAAVLFAEAQARAREQAAYEQLKASGMLTEQSDWLFREKIKLAHANSVQ